MSFDQIFDLTAGGYLLFIDNAVQFYPSGMMRRPFYFFTSHRAPCCNIITSLSSTNGLLLPPHISRMPGISTLIAWIQVGRQMGRPLGR